MPSIRELREGFEVWAKEENLDLKKGRLDYEDDVTYTSWCAWRAALSAAPTPPEVEPIAEIVAEDMGNPFNAARIRAHFYKEIPAIGTKLYTSSPSPKASWDADGNPTNLEAAARDVVDNLFKYATETVGTNRLRDNLRKFLPEGK